MTMEENDVQLTARGPITMIVSQMHDSTIRVGLVVRLVNDIVREDDRRPRLAGELDE